MIKSRSVLLSLVLSLAHGALMDRCGDCWCAPGDGGTCPTDETGLVDAFDASTECVLSSFVLTGSPSFLELQTADGQPCYPFAGSLGSISTMPQTQLPACSFPTSTDTSVCAYKYNPNNTTCVGRQYDLVTYDSEADAIADSASVTHTGACGVCSSAQDFWIRIRDLDSLETNSVVCATAYTLSGASDRFDTLIKCYTDMGFTTPCATLWAHLGAVTAIECGAVCIPDATGVTKLNEDPPTCELAPCLACSESFQADFDILAGRTLYNSGITERIVRPCDAFSRIEHEHCVGTQEIGNLPCLGEGTQAPAGESSTESTATGSRAVSQYSAVVGLLGVSIMAAWNGWMHL